MPAVVLCPHKPLLFRSVRTSACRQTRQTEAVFLVLTEDIELETKIDYGFKKKIY
jgi:hypothetical protein